MREVYSRQTYETCATHTNIYTQPLTCCLMKYVVRGYIGKYTQKRGQNRIIRNLLCPLSAKFTYRLKGLFLPTECCSSLQELEKANIRALFSSKQQINTRYFMCSNCFLLGYFLPQPFYRYLTFKFASRSRGSVHYMAILLYFL